MHPAPLRRVFVVLAAVLALQLQGGRGEASVDPFDVAFVLVGGVSASSVTLAVAVRGPVDWTPPDAAVVASAVSVQPQGASVTAVSGPGDGVRLPTVGVRVAVVKVVLASLPPASPVSYVVGDVSGTVQTLPTRAGSDTFEFSFAMASCARTGSDAPVFDAVRAAQPLFFLQMGDLFYGDIETPDVALYLEQYYTALTAPRQRALFATTPLVYTWDDHDFGPNNSDGSMACGPGAAAAYRMVVPHPPLPADALPAAADGGKRQRGIYHAFSVGRARFIVSDLRSQRVPRFEDDSPSKTCLGFDQRSWLLQELETAAATHDVVFWVSSMPWHDANKKWGWYATEQAVIVQALLQHHVAEKLVVLSGDAHMLAVDDGTNSPGGVTVLHAAAMDHHPSSKGGPYSHGAVPGTGQWGLVHVACHANGTTTVTFSGQRTDETSGATQTVLSFQGVYPAPAPGAGAARTPRKKGRAAAFLERLRDAWVPRSVLRWLKGTVLQSPPYVLFKQALLTSSGPGRVALLGVAFLVFFVAMFLVRWVLQVVVSALCRPRGKPKRA